MAPTKFGASAAALGNSSGSGTARSHDIFFRFLIRRDSLTCHFGADGDVVVDRGRLGRRAGHVLDPLRQVVRVVRNGEHVGQDADPGRSQLLGVGGLTKNVQYGYGLPIFFPCAQMKKILPHQLLGRLEIAAGHLDDDGGDEVLLPHPGLRQLHPLLGRQREGTFSGGAVDWNSCQHMYT